MPCEKNFEKTFVRAGAFLLKVELGTEQLAPFSAKKTAFAVLSEATGSGEML
jgi:hypothetical protein